jgi:hypothetical protein
MTGIWALAAGGGKSQPQGLFQERVGFHIDKYTFFCVTLQP